jgi:hypothetical protein
MIWPSSVVGGKKCVGLYGQSLQVGGSMEKCVQDGGQQLGTAHVALRLSVSSKVEGIKVTKQSKVLWIFESVRNTHISRVCLHYKASQFLWPLRKYT